MYTILLVVQVLLAVGVIVLVLLQHGKGADAGAAFGSGASATVFGAQGSASFLTRATAVLATLFFVNSLLLSSPWVIGGEQVASGSVAEKFKPTVTQQPAPAGGEETAPAGGEQPAPAASDLPAADLPEVPEPAPADKGQGSDLPE
ncbi:MAG TPA: preprotein translocase subunit SecG [Thiotrichales bacterium]|nr:preprotein translocase subunit SecG [Thiotrichales bacterium]